MKILLVDDNEMLLDQFNEFLSIFHEVTPLLNPTIAMQLLAVEKFDLLLTDYNMPDLNGYQLALFAVESCNTKSIILTGDVDFTCDDSRIKVAYKPIPLRTLESLITNA